VIESFDRGFTPVKRESRNTHAKEDDSQKIFVFVLKNPPTLPARRFALTAE
jgi:hypothetical protein